MELESFTLRINDLPKVIEVRIPDGATEETVQQIIEDVKTEVIYNSRYGEESDSREPRIEIVERTTNLIKLKIT